MPDHSWPHYGRLIYFREAYIDLGPGEPPGTYVSIRDDGTEVWGLIVSGPHPIEGCYESVEGDLFWVRIWTSYGTFLMHFEDVNTLFELGLVPGAA